MSSQSSIPETRLTAADEAVQDTAAPISLALGPGDVGSEAAPSTSTSSTTDFLEYLSSALSGDYVVQRELGIGGMATVYLAHDCRHDRQVALKVLRPDIAAVLGSDRFKREIKLAAGLSHPNIMPVHDSGDVGGFLYYVMPMVSGPSLRERLEADGRLPVNEALRIARGVAAALDFAHRHGVVHRDIKPENIMLHEGLPLVADFGIGKAMSSVGDVGLTLSGVAIGTPAYMSPEQAAGDEELDGRSDIYSLGCVLFEMLTGQQPFTGPTAQVVIARRFVQNPTDVTELCSDVSPAVANLVQRAMARDPQERYQSGSALAAAIGSLVDTDTHQVFLNGDSSGEVRSPAAQRPTGIRDGATAVQATVPSSQAVDARSGYPMRRSGELPAEVARGVDRRRKKKAPVGESVRAATVFGLAGVGVLSIVHFLVGWLGLPNWVLPGALVWLAAGVPVMLLTGRQEFKRTVARAGGAQTRASGIRGHLTWRNAVLGGGVALSLLVVFTASFMVMRIVGVRPVGTLMATGEFEEGGRVVLGEFTDRTDEPGLAAAVTEALRVDLAQSPVVSLLSQTAMREALGRMGLAPATKIDRQVALEIAVREGIPAVVVGEVLSVGHGFVLSARVIRSADDQELLALRETASDVSDVLAAVERLSRHLRERIGESLRNLRSSPALSSVTTTSLPALRSFSAGVQLIREGKWSQANDDLAEAVGLDSTFAEAYVRLGYNLNNQGGARSAAVDAMAAAFRHRSHLPESRRKSVEAAYYSMIGEPSKSAAAYAASLASGDRSVLNNLALQYLTLRQPARAVDVLMEAQGDSPNAGIIAVNLTRALFRTGGVDQAFQVWNAFTDSHPDYPLNARHTSRLEVARDSIRAAQAVLEEVEQTEDHFAAVIVSRYRAFLSAAMGRLSDALEILEVQRDEAVVLGDNATAFATEVKAAELLLGNGRSSNEVARVLDNAVGREGFGTLAPLDRLLPTRARLRAQLGDLDQARRLLREHEIEVLALYPNIDQQSRLLAVAELELAEGRVMDAAVTFRIADMGRCVICALPGLARAYEHAGEVDSAIVTYERFLSTPYADRIDLIGVDQAGVLMRLGQLHEVQGNRDAAVSYYDRFIELRRDADPVLQQAVQEARERRLQLLRQ